MAITTLTADSHAIALLCSTLALPPRTELKPLAPHEWNQLATQIKQSPLGRPGELLGKNEDELAAELALPRELARRLVALLARGGQLAFELERLTNRGLWLLTRADDEYPLLWKRRLRAQAPPVVFGAGSQSLLDQRSLAVVGSRDVDRSGLEFAEMLGRRCAREGLAVASGAARGVDITAMLSAINSGGNSVGVLADSLEKTAQRRELREPIIDGNLTLITPYHPAARFNVGHAMRRNALIYCMAEAAVVVASSRQKGGTSAGALENLKAAWVPLYVRDDGSEGNADLIRQGALPFPSEALDPDAPLPVTAVAEQPTELTIAHASIGVGKSVVAARASRPFDDQPPAVDETTTETPARSPTEADSAVQTDGMPTEPAVVEADLFMFVWPRLAAYLLDERSEREVAERFQLELSQTRAWLKRAVTEGLAERLASKRRYVVTERQSSLFAADR
jgi:predicted Rossmann fold nucleotide-binding protein DprA/Smf involved in DNA uptake